MEIIPVTSEVSIEYEPTQWRLVQDYDNSKALRPLVAANPSRLVFHPVFSAAHHLPFTEIPAAQVSQVVLGWTPEEQTWQLGLYLRNNSVGTGDLIWCRLAAWSPGQAAQAKAAGEGLSGIINRPFQLIGGESEGTPQVVLHEATQPSMHTNPMIVNPVLLRTLPINTGDWTLRSAAQGVAWQLTEGWTLRHSARVLFFCVIFILFLLLGAGSLRSGLAPVTPEWLPVVAFGIALILAYNMLENIWQLITKRQVIIDKERREIRCERVLTGLVDWRVPFGSVEFILISQEPARPQGRRSRDDPMHIAQDSWVHLYAHDRFYLLSELEDVEGKSWQWENVRRRTAADHRIPIDLTEYDTPLHHAVMQMANHIGVSAYVDIR